MKDPYETIVNQQMLNIDASDDLASAWEDALSSVSEQSSFRQQSMIWGGKGKGGRGVSRRTIQPRDVILDNVNLEYISDATSGTVGSNVLLQNAILKLLHGRVYALVGNNGCGKSTLLRRMSQKKIPGFTSLHLKIQLVPQEILKMDNETPMDVIIRSNQQNQVQSRDAIAARIRDLENELEGLDLDCPDNGGANVKRMEQICNDISILEEIINEPENEAVDDADNDIQYKVAQVLEYFGIHRDLHREPMGKLSGGEKKKVFLACSLFCDLDILLLDEPTNHLDMEGIIHLRGLIQTMHSQQTTVVLVSHDTNLINSVATDVIHFSNRNLNYYRGNYIDFTVAKQQHDLHMTRQQLVLDKQRDLMIKSIDNMSKKITSASNSGSKKISRAINSRKKKLERHGIDKDMHGHRLTEQTAGTGIKIGSINSLDATTRKKQTYKQMIGRDDISVAPIPNKAVQFIFRNTDCIWGEPLISATDVGHSFLQEENQASQKSLETSVSPGFTQENKGMLFDSVDLIIDEKSIACILGKNSSGKTTLLRILAKQIRPSEGKVHHVPKSNICYIDQHMTDELIADGIHKYGSNTSSIALLSHMYPQKSEQDIRGTLADFGLHPQQASTYIQFLSGGERCRLSLAMSMLQKPDVLIMDEPSNHLDPESVEALAYGLKSWNGTVVMVSHDVHFIRLLEATCYVLFEKEKKLRRLDGGIDAYLTYLGANSYNGAL